MRYFCLFVQPHAQDLKQTYTESIIPYLVRG